MSDFEVEVSWRYAPQADRLGEYSRKHEWRLGGEQVLNASSLIEYGGDADCANPEEALVAAVSSCHMLTFLAVAAKRGFDVRHYRDCASGTLGKNTEGRISVTEVVLDPTVEFGEKVPSAEELNKLHDTAHRNCFIGNSVRASVRIGPAN